MNMKKSIYLHNYYGDYENDPLGLFAAEIVMHAITDWRWLIKEKAWQNEEEKPLCNFTELRAFFNSEWCAFLLEKWSMESTRILELLEAELQEAMQQPA